jgi:crotonobetainyl-CoA:carnitine CoA-transferase CaiB-like acyl-CoA transferase
VETRGGIDLLRDVAVIEVGGDVTVRCCGRLFAAFGARVLRPRENETAWSDAPVAAA